MFRNFLNGSALVAASLVSVSATAENLNDALIAAYLNNPTLAAQRAALRATDEGVATAIAGWRPTVKLTGTAGRSEVDTQATRETVITPKTRNAELTQNIYQGGRTLSAIDQAESNVKAGRATLLVTEQTVLLAAVTAYMDVLRDEAVVELRRNNEQVLRRQLDATRDRFRVGEITRTDVAQAEARLERAVSDRVQAEGNLTSSRATYRRVVGESPTKLDQPSPLSNLPSSQDEAVAVATSENPSVVTAVHTEDAARHAVKTAEGVILPTLGFTATWSRTDDASQTSQTAARDRPAFNQTNSFLFTLTVPLYQSGSEWSSIRGAKQTASQRRIQVDEAKRSAVESATRAWEALTTQRAVIQSRTQQVRAAELALEGVREEANVGSRTTLDVLDSEQELLDARVALVTSRRDEFVAAFTLQSAVGRLTAQHLALPVQHYDATKNYKAVRDSWIGGKIDGE
jgi:TolC family type I secretion outer membrane protein